MHTTYTGQLVRIRPFRSADELALVAVHESNRPNNHWGYWQWAAREAHNQFDKAGMLATDAYSTFAIDRLDSGELVGYEEYGPVKPGHLSTWLGTGIFREHWSNGFGREAKLLVLCYLFENFRLHTVFADTTATHTRAQAGLEAIGMRKVGERRCAHWFKGRYVGVPQYQILRSEWEAMDYRQTVQRG